MSRFYSETEVVARVPGLTGARLVRFVEVGIVLPVKRDKAQGYQRVDLARLELACELADQFALEEDALALVLSLVDQLHAKHAEMQVLRQAVAAQPKEIRARISAALRAATSA